MVYPFMCGGGVDAWRSVVAKDIVVITRSLNEGRIKQNIEGSVKAAKTLTKEDLAKLDGIAAAGKQQRMVMPPWGAFASSFSFFPSEYPTMRPMSAVVPSVLTVV